MAAGKRTSGRSAAQNAVDIDMDCYDVKVKYESSQISESSNSNQQQNLAYANISFQDKHNNETVYTVVCDTGSGEVLTLTRSHTLSEEDSYMEIAFLEKIADEFFEKMTGLRVDEIRYFDEGVSGSVYTADFYMENSEQPVTIKMDAYDGNVFYYMKTE